MAADNPNGHFMRDQYLELLWTAQKIEDHRLVDLILRRFKAMAIEMTLAPVSACEVIPFPGMVACTNVPCAGCDAIRPLWPRRPLRHVLAILFGYCSVVLFFGFFGLSA